MAQFVLSDIAYALELLGNCSCKIHKTSINTTLYNNTRSCSFYRTQHNCLCRTWNAPLTTDLRHYQRVQSWLSSANSWKRVLSQSTSIEHGCQQIVGHFSGIGCQAFGNDHRIQFRHWLQEPRMITKILNILYTKTFIVKFFIIAEHLCLPNKQTSIRLS